MSRTKILTISAASLFILSTLFLFAKSNDEKLQGVNDNPILKDTLNEIVTDSLTNDFGGFYELPDKMIKYFKYIGHDSIRIIRAWTGDPHYICQHPDEYLIQDKIYSFTVCFARMNGYYGVFAKSMGFDLSNGKRIIFTFKGNRVKKE